MLVEKAIGTVPHTGGKLFSKNSKHWHTLVDWLKDGANKDPEDIAKPTNIELFLLQPFSKVKEPLSN